MSDRAEWKPTEIAAELFAKWDKDTRSDTKAIREGELIRRIAATLSSPSPPALSGECEETIAHLKASADGEIIRAECFAAGSAGDARCRARAKTFREAASLIERQAREIAELHVIRNREQEKRAPVQGYEAGIPWSMHLRAYDAYCKEYGPQKALIDLEGRGCRGGFGVGELDDFIPGWREELSEITALKGEVSRLTRELAEARAANAEMLRALKFADKHIKLETVESAIRLAARNPADGERR